MAFGGGNASARISAERLAAVSGGGGRAPTTGAVSAAPSATGRRASVEPDLSRIRKNMIDETPEARKKRLAAKTVNFGATIIARIVIIGAAVFYAYDAYQSTGVVHRGVAVGVFAMLGDLGRVVLKAMEPGSK